MQRFPASFRVDDLALRRWRPDDAELLGAAVGESVEHLRSYMPWIAQEPLSIEARRALLVEWEREWLAGGDVVYGIFEDGEVAGGTGLHPRIGPHGLEIGYWLHPQHLGRGIATRCAAGLTTLAFTHTDIDRVEIHHDITNVSSRRIPERLGYRLVDRMTPNRDLAPGETGVELVWRVTREQWEQRLAG